jgi:hypothetical protein
MGRFGAVFTASEALIHKNFIVVADAFEGFFFVLVAFGRVILICFVAGTFGVFICTEGNVVLAVRGIVVGRFLAGHTFGGLFSGAPFGNLIVVAAIIVGASRHEEFILDTIRAMFVCFREGGSRELIAIDAFGDFVCRGVFTSVSDIGM